MINNKIKEGDKTIFLDFRQYKVKLAEIESLGENKTIEAGGLSKTLANIKLRFDNQFHQYLMARKNVRHTKLGIELSEEWMLCNNTQDAYKAIKNKMHQRYIDTKKITQLTQTNYIQMIKMLKNMVDKPGKNY